MEITPKAAGQISAVLKDHQRRIRNSPEAGGRWFGSEDVWHFGYARLTEALAPNSSAAAVLVTRNTGDTGWTDSAVSITLYAPPLMLAGDANIASGTYVHFDVHDDPAFPHYVVILPRCPELGS